MPHSTTATRLSHAFIDPRIYELGEQDLTAVTREVSRKVKASVSQGLSCVKRQDRHLFGANNQLVVHSGNAFYFLCDLFRFSSEFIVGDLAGEHHYSVVG